MAVIGGHRVPVSHGHVFLGESAHPFETHTTLTIPDEKGNLTKMQMFGGSDDGMFAYHFVPHRDPRKRRMGWGGVYPVDGVTDVGSFLDYYKDLGRPSEEDRDWNMDQLARSSKETGNGRFITGTTEEDPSQVRFDPRSGHVEGY